MATKQKSIFTEEVGRFPIHSAFTFSKLTMETLEQSVKYVQS